MADGVEIKLTGFKELSEKLRAFGPKVTRNGLRATAFAGAAVIREATKQTTAFQDRTGTLRANIIATKRRGGDETAATYRVTVSAKKKKYVNNARNRLLKRVGKKHRINKASMYGRYLEFGTSKMSPHPFLRPAFFANVDKAIAAMRARLVKAIEQAAR